jgi:hypothetical protein
MAINDVNVKDKVDIKGDGEGGGEICGIDLYPQAHRHTGHTVTTTAAWGPPV